MTEPGKIQLTRHIRRAPAEVWAALTDPHTHARWWAAGDVRAVPGHRFTLDMGLWGQQPCEVTAVEHQRLLSYTFATGTLDTTITWRLAAECEGTSLSLEHDGFDLDSPAGQAAFQGMSKGWPTVVSRLETVLAG